MTDLTAGELRNAELNNNKKDSLHVSVLCVYFFLSCLYPNLLYFWVPFFREGLGFLRGQKRYMIQSYITVMP